ncbi:hypothetical protein K439DRAFT_1624043 [Ramaria rubella]|nr:hypothetical protein K439DRAFT_1624043 [Ramaria rubella]
MVVSVIACQSLPVVERDARLESACRRLSEEARLVLPHAITDWETLCPYSRPIEASMHSRRPLPALALVMPHPQLPTRAHLSPHTPRACTPSTPVLFPKQLIASPRTSTDSWNSSSGTDDVQWEWKQEQMSLLVRTLDALPGHLYTPFNGPVPPSNLLDKIARSVSQAQGPLEWPHSIRATRAKLVEIARARDKDRSKENMTIDEQDEDEIVEATSRSAKRPLYRQSSMDFLLSRDKGSGSLSRLSSRLQRTDRIVPYHPYARPASRSPSPPTLPDSPRKTYFPAADGYFSPVTSFVPPRPRAIRTRTSSISLGSLPPPPPSLRRSVSALSTHSNPIPSSTLGRPANTGVLPLTPSKTACSPVPTPAPVRASLPRRADSFSHVAPLPPTLKRAPSFGAGSIVSAKSKDVKAVARVTEKQSQEPESDEEEKVRQKKAKRPRTRSTHASASAESKDPLIAKPASKSKSKSRANVPSPRVREPNVFGAELPTPQSERTLPCAKTRSNTKPSHKSSPHTRMESATPLPAGQTKTLRRVKTTTFNLALGTGTGVGARPCPMAMARRISFGSLAVPPEEQEQEGGLEQSRDGMSSQVEGLGSAFQMS